MTQDASTTEVPAEHGQEVGFDRFLQYFLGLGIWGFEKFECESLWKPAISTLVTTMHSFRNSSLAEERDVQNVIWLRDTGTPDIKVTTRRMIRSTIMDRADGKWNRTC